MSYYLYDARGYLTDGPSIQGWEDFIKWGVGLAPIEELASDGATDDLEGLVEVLEQQRATGSVEKTRKAMLEAALHAEDVLILSDGVGEELRTLGGPGSGNFGHAGRPGQVGGSSVSTQEAVQDYVSLSSDINSSLRDGVQLSPYEQKVADAFDSALSQSQLPHATKLFRAVPSTVFDRFQDGDTYSDPAFMSTSVRPDISSKMTEMLADSGIDEDLQTVEIIAPKGTPAINVSAELGDSHLFNWQKEIVLPRGIQFRVERQGSKVKLHMLPIRALGGPGSGNFGHAGRPGQVGGSSDDGFPSGSIRDGSVSDRMEREHRLIQDRHAEYRREEMSETADQPLQWYRSNAYSTYNANCDNPDANDDTKEAIREIQEAILDAPEVDNVLTYRALSLGTESAERFYEKMKPGETIETKGFQSTSFSLEQSAQFLASSGGVTGTYDLKRGVLLEIEANRGLHLGSEDEFLLPHGSQFEVVAIKDVEVSLRGQTETRKIVQLRQVEREDYPTGVVDAKDDEDDEDYDYDDDDEDDGPNPDLDFEGKPRKKKGPY